MSLAIAAERPGGDAMDRLGASLDLQKDDQLRLGRSGNRIHTE